MARRHSGSLVEKEFHDPALLRLMRSPLTNRMVACIAEKTVDSVKCRPPPSNLITPPLTPGSAPQPGDPLPPLDYFIKSVVRKSKCHVPTLLCTMVYLDRLKERLPNHARGCYTTRHRVFLAALIVAAKYLNDSSPQNKHWVRYSVHFTPAEVNLMERQLLTIFNFDLRFTEEELLHHLRPLMEPVPAPADSFYRPVVSSSIPLRPHSPLAVDPHDAPPEPAPVKHVRNEGDVNRLLRSDHRRKDEIIARRPYRPLAYDDVDSSPSPPSSAAPGPKRLTPAYRLPHSQSSTDSYARATPPPAYSAGPVAPFPALSSHRPILRPGTSYSSLASTNSRGSRPPSWGSDDTAASPRSSAELARTPPPSGPRVNRLSSHSSTSTLSSTSSGPRTPSPPLPLPYHSSIPFIPADGSTAPLNLPKKPASAALDTLTALPQLSSHRREPSYAPPSPSLIHALAHDPDLWPLMSTSASYAKQDRDRAAARLVKGEMRVIDADKREREGRLGLNLRAGERREGVWAVSATGA
ncbi:hypothetical protein JCM8097_000336 [Rhodosporidiobolus ruineniae]